MAMATGERQVSPTLDGVRRDHVARYEMAARIIPPKSRVLDFACGIAYGSKIMADAGHIVSGFDLSPDALNYGLAHYDHENIKLYECDGGDPGILPQADVAVSFETIEHLADPRPLLRALRMAAPTLIASVPNESVMPFVISPGITTAFHHRHYTWEEFDDLLSECGWHVTEWYGQAGPHSEVEPNVNGRTLVAVCTRFAAVQPVAPSKSGLHVAILGLGPSANQYLELTKRFGGRRAYCDETWGINALGDVFTCDRIFHMDDVRIQEIRAAAKPESNIARMLEWLRTTPVPVVTSRAHEGYPALQEFPLAEVLSEFPLGYFNSTAAYAVAYALHIGATKLSLFGLDFTYGNREHAEKGRACVEFWLGIAAERGVELAMPKTTSLMDAWHTQPARFYGYDTLELAFDRDDAGLVRVTRTPRAALPSAEEIEQAYDHSTPVAEQYCPPKE